MKIGILAKSSNTYSNHRLLHAGKACGHEMHLINISFCYMNISATHPEVYYRDSKVLNNIDALIPRFNAANTSYGTAVLRQFEGMGVYSLNNAISINSSRDKLRAVQLLTRKSIPMPITGFADSPQDAEKLINLVGGAPLIVKILDGTVGKGIIFTETQQAAVSVINAFKHLKANILVQEYIKEAEGRDIRCFVIGQKVLAAIQRSPETNNTKQGFHATDAIPIKLKATERKMVLLAAKAMKLNIASVDLIRAQRGPLILDIDPCPDLELLERTTGKDLALKIIHFIEEQKNIFNNK